MADKDAFGQVADPLTVTFYDQRCNDGEAERAMEDIIDWAEEEGIDVKATRLGDVLQVTCSSLEDADAVRDLGRSNFPYHEHYFIHYFNGETPDWRSTWVYSAREALERAGIPYEFEEASGHPCFVFENTEAVLAFRGLTESGVIEARTQARLATEGPAAPGALPY